MCVEHQNAQTNTNNVNKTWSLPQTTGGKDEPNIVFIFSSRVAILLNKKRLDICEDRIHMILYDVINIWQSDKEVLSSNMHKTVDI